MRLVISYWKFSYSQYCKRAGGACLCLNVIDFVNIRSYKSNQNHVYQRLNFYCSCSFLSLYTGKRQGETVAKEFPAWRIGWCKTDWRTDWWYWDIQKERRERAWGTHILHTPTFIQNFRVVTFRKLCDI